MSRIINWLTYTVFFAILPLIFSLLIHYFNDTFKKEYIINSPEILFFSLIVSATTIGDLVNNGNILKKNLVKFFHNSLFMGAIFSAFLYGAFLLNKSQNFKLKLFYFSIMWAIIFLILSFITQILIVKSEANQNG